MIRCIIVDDELPARECLQNYLHEYCTDIQVVAQADSVRSALNEIIKHRPDLVFLDVEMPNGNGFDLLRQLNRIDFHVIFVTAYEEYAVMAFRFSAADFLLKPINIRELTEAVEKVRQEIARKQEMINIEALLQITRSGKDQFKTMVVSNNDGFKVIQVADIITCEADGYCTVFHLKGERKLVATKNLKYYDELLTGQGFQRVHNSFLINLDQVVSYSSEGVITLNEGQLAPLGNTYKKKFMEYFDTHK